MTVELSKRPLWLAVGWGLVLAVVYLSLTTQPIEIPIATFGDKIGHILAYAALMAWWSQLDRRHCRLALMFVLLGLAMEIVQSFTDYRSADVFDETADCIGVGLGWLVTRLLPDWLGWVDKRVAA